MSRQIQDGSINSCHGCINVLISRRFSGLVSHMNKLDQARNSWISPNLRRVHLSRAELQRLFPEASAAVIDRAAGITAEANAIAR